MTPPISNPDAPGGGDIHERIDQTVGRAKEGTANVVAGAKDKADAAADQVGQRLNRAIDATAHGAHRTVNKAADWRDRGTELASDVRDRADEATDTLRAWIRDKPLQSFAIALAAGWLLGRVLKARN